jgi:hypothetical protein
MRNYFYTNGPAPIAPIAEPTEHIAVIKADQKAKIINIREEEE